jgi:hypothetical protein
VAKQCEMEFNPKFEKIQHYRNIIDTANKAIEFEETHPDDPMEIDYTLSNLVRQLPANKSKKVVNRVNPKKKPKPKPKKGSKKLKKKVKHIIYNHALDDYEYDENASEEYDSEEEDETDSDEEEYDETYTTNAVKKKKNLF